mmetsp:Transcript_33160/g.97835  ORF Transcript_33160/g.97835 Transcript_33160/m.97835 type:complete len:566 (+) Transcript_33160:500-2197(+)
MRLTLVILHGQSLSIELSLGQPGGPESHNDGFLLLLFFACCCSGSRLGAVGGVGIVRLLSAVRLNRIVPDRSSTEGRGRSHRRCSRRGRGAGKRRIGIVGKVWGVVVATPHKEGGSVSIQVGLEMGWDERKAMSVAEEGRGIGSDGALPVANLEEFAPLVAPRSGKGVVDSGDEGTLSLLGMVGSGASSSLGRGGDHGGRLAIEIVVIVLGILSQAASRHSLAPRVNASHNGTAQRPLPLFLLAFPAIGLVLLLGLLLHDALHTFGLDAAERYGGGIQLVEHLPRLLVHGPAAGPGRLGRASGQVAVRADNVVIDVAPGRRGVGHLAMAEALLLPILAGWFLLLLAAGVRIARIARRCSCRRSRSCRCRRSGGGGRTALLGRLALLLLLHLQPTQGGPAPRFGHVEPCLPVLEGRFRPAQDSGHHQHLHVPEHLVREDVRPALVGLGVDRPADLGRVEAVGEGRGVHVLGRVADDGVDEPPVVEMARHALQRGQVGRTEVRVDADLDVPRGRQEGRHGPPRLLLRLLLGSSGLSGGRRYGPSCRFGVQILVDVRNIDTCQFVKCK